MSEIIRLKPIFVDFSLNLHRYGTTKDYNRFANDYLKLYNDTIAKSVNQHDKWHIWLYSSPSNGKKRSNVSIIQENPQDWHYGDSN